MSDCTESGHGHSHSHTREHGPNGKLLLIGGIALLAIMRHKRRMAMLEATEAGIEAGAAAPWMARGFGRGPGHGPGHGFGAAPWAGGMHQAFAKHAARFAHGFPGPEDVTDL